MIGKDETKVLTPKGILACTVKNESEDSDNIRMVFRKGKKEDDISLAWFLSEVMKAKRK